jgi:hypothetical protein
MDGLGGDCSEQLSFVSHVSDRSANIKRRCALMRACTGTSPPHRNGIPRVSGSRMPTTVGVPQQELIAAGVDNSGNERNPKRVGVPSWSNRAHAGAKKIKPSRKRKEKKIGGRNGGGGSRAAGRAAADGYSMAAVRTEQVAAGR